MDSASAATDKPCWSRAARSLSFAMRSDRVSGRLGTPPPYGGRREHVQSCSDQVLGSRRILFSVRETEPARVTPQDRTQKWRRTRSGQNLNMLYMFETGS